MAIAYFTVLLYSAELQLCASETTILLIVSSRSGRAAHTFGFGRKYAKSEQRGDQYHRNMGIP